MKAIILAAGRGSRMGGLTDTRPKCLTHFNGKPLIDWQIGAIREAGIDKIAIVRGYLGAFLLRYNVSFFENIRWHQTNMVASLMCAQSWLQEDTCIVSYSDIIYPSDIVNQLIKEHGDVVITYDKNWLQLWKARFDNILSDAETFQIDKNGVLLEIGNRASNTNKIQGQYMGLLKFSPKGWHETAELLSSLSSDEQDQIDMTSLLSKLIQSGYKIKTVPVESGWGEIDNEADLKLYTSIIKSKGALWQQKAMKKQTLEYFHAQ